jgi:acetylxylan esterase
MRITRVLTGMLAAVTAFTAAAVAFGGPAAAASLTEVTGFGTNPSSLRMFVYVPDTVAARPAVVVAPHYCHGDGPAFFNGSGLAPQADRYGFVVIFPSVTQSADGCFDVSSTATLTHNGGGDSLGIVSMVRYALQRYNGDPSRVYATGVSSGGMMTNVLLGSYPDVFKAGSAFAGVPFGCFAGPTPYYWNGECAAGRVTRTAREWGDLVRAAYPGYTGPRPRMQLWHGTNDEILNYVNFGEAIEQWTDVLGVSGTPVTTEPDTPQAGWTRTRYGSAGENAAVEAISLAGVPHNLPYSAAAAVHFFGLDTAGPSPSSAAPSSARPSSARPSSAAPSSAAPSSLTPGGCTAQYTVDNAWPGGFVGGVTVTAGASTLTGWTVTLALPSGTALTQVWNGQATGSTGTVRVTNASWNGRLTAGQSTRFGFQGTGSGTGVTATCTAQ